MPSPGPDAARLAEIYRLALGERRNRGPAGERLGKGTGASLEFQDRRVYAAGDDVRHLDWAAYARTDQMMVRLYREEVLPTVELLIDGSRSMAVDADKAQLTADLAGMLIACCRADGYHVRPILLGERPEVASLERIESEGFRFEGQAPLAAGVQESLALLRPGSIRVLLSDFLSPHDAALLLRPLAGRAGDLILLQVLGAEDVDPIEGDALRLEDVENGESIDLVLDHRTVEGYRERLRNLQDALALEVRRAGGRYVSVTAGTGLEELCRGRLAQEGILVPA